jgi:hypothetical protein
MDPFTLKKPAGHGDLNTTMRYVHLNYDDARAAAEKARGGHKPGHAPNSSGSEEESKIAVTEFGFRN